MAKKNGWQAISNRAPRSVPDDPRGIHAGNHSVCLVIRLLLVSTLLLPLVVGISARPSEAGAAMCPGGSCRAHATEHRWCRPTVSYSFEGSWTGPGVTLRDNIYTAALIIDEAMSTDEPPILLRLQRVPPGNGDIKIYFDLLDNPDAWASTVPDVLGDEIVGVRTTFDTSPPLGYSWTNQSYNISTGIHELLHALGLTDEYCAECATTTVTYCCDDPTRFAPPVVDVQALTALECRYGNDGSCSTTIIRAMVDWDADTATQRVIRGNCTDCNKPCLGSALAGFGALGQSFTYALAISNAGGPFVDVAMLTEADWSDDEYELVLSQSYQRAVLRMTVLDNGQPVDQVHTYPPRDIARSTYTITASAGGNGSISPSDKVAVGNGLSQTFTMIPDPGYGVADVLVDGSSVGAMASYTFTGVAADHSIGATFGAGLLVGVPGQGQTTAVWLGSAIPNPVRTATRIPFGLPTEMRVSLSVRDAAGRQVASLVHGRLLAGEHEVQWDGRDAAGRVVGSGVYFCHLATGGMVLTQPLVRIR